MLEYIVAIDETRVRFPADVYCSLYDFCEIYDGRLYHGLCPLALLFALVFVKRWALKVLWPGTNFKKNVVADQN